MGLRTIESCTKRKAIRGWLKMLSDRLDADLCPACHPARKLDASGACTDPRCAFAAGAGPLPLHPTFTAVH